MWPWSKQKAAKSDNGSGRNQRRSERIQTAVLSCDLGPIVEISRHGMRVRVQRQVGFQAGAEVEIELSAPTDGMALKARVVRVESTGGGRYEIAMEFVGLGEERAVAIENLARHGKKKVGSAFSSEDQREKLVAALKMPDYYEVLGVQPGASIEQVQGAYRMMARKYHPDVCREDGAVQRFCLINDAHEMLCDGARRAEYDALYVLRRAA